jgi:acetylglutamate kinase
VDEAIRKAQVLIEALDWIRRFRGRHVVIKLGGSALEEPEAVKSFLTDVVFMETVGMRPILIHGGGKAISRAMNEAGIEPRFVHGRRYTDRQTLDIVARVLAEEICQSLVDEINRQGGRAKPLSYVTENCLIGEKLTLETETGEALDLGFVGQVVNLDRQLLVDTCNSGTIPVIPSVALDANGQKLNVNADTAAAAVARLLGAEKLVFLSDVPGIFLKRKDPNSLISHLDARRCRQLIAEGVIDAGMVPKVDAALEALAAGVGKVHIIDAGMPHSLLLEIYSNTGIGTEIVS